MATGAGGALSTGAPGSVLVVSSEPADATTTIFFGGRLDVPGDNLHVVRHDRRNYATPLAAANAIILVRGLFEFADISHCGHALGTPTYYFCDDNFMVLRDHGEPAARFAQAYTDDRVRAALRPCAGVLVSTSALAEFFAQRQLHPRIHLYPPMMATPVPHRHDAQRATHVAFFGGRHLHAFFHDPILPALRRVAARQPLTLTTVGLDDRIGPSPGLTISHLPYQPSYEAGVAALERARLGVLLHPLATDLPNNRYKNPHALITALALGAMPVVSNAAPYADAVASHAALGCDDTEESWCQQIQRAVADRAVRHAVHDRLTAYCRERFDGLINRQVIRGILETHPSPDPMWQPFRSAAAATHLIVSRAGRAVASRMARSADGPERS